MIFLLLRLEIQWKNGTEDVLNPGQRSLMVFSQACVNAVLKTSQRQKRKKKSAISIPSSFEILNFLVITEFLCSFWMFLKYCMKILWLWMLSFQGLPPQILHPKQVPHLPALGTALCEPYRNLRCVFLRGGCAHSGFSFTVNFDVKIPSNQGSSLAVNLKWTRISVKRSWHHEGNGFQFTCFPLLGIFELKSLLRLLMWVCRFVCTKSSKNVTALIIRLSVTAHGPKMSQGHFCGEYQSMKLNFFPGMI